MTDIGAEAGIVGSGIYRHFGGKTAILVAMADRVMDRLMDRAAEIIAAGLDDRQSLSLLVRDHIEVALTDRDALAVYHREVRTLPEDERRRLSRSQRHYIEEWVHLLAPLRPDLADGEVRLAVHAAIGAIQSTLFFRSGLADERLVILLTGIAHACLGINLTPASEPALTRLARFRLAGQLRLPDGRGRGTAPCPRSHRLPRAGSAPCLSGARPSSCDSTSV